MPKEQPNHKHNVEAVLFSTGRKMHVDEIAKLCKILRDDAISALKELQADYNARNSSLMVIDEGETWKLTIRERHLPVVKKIVAETELPKSVVETLAVIAWKAPVLQSDIIKVRTNKAYDHLKELEESGYIMRQKNGRTNLIKLTQKFFQYFDLPPEKLQQMFTSITEMEEAIMHKEQQLEQATEQHRKQEAELRAQQELARKMTETQIIDDTEIDLVDEHGTKAALAVYEDIEKKKPHVTVYTDTGAEVATEIAGGQNSATEEKKSEINAEENPKERASNELVDKRVQELLHPKSLEPDTDSPDTEHEYEQSSEEKDFEEKNEEEK